MLGDRRHRGTGGARPPLRRTEIGGIEEPVKPEGQERSGLLHRLAQQVRILPSQVPGIGARRQGGHGDVDVEALLPLVEALGRRLTGRVRVVGQNHPAGEVLQ